MKLNRGGLKLCGVYFVFCILLIGLASFTENAKGSAVLIALSVFPAVIFFASTGLGNFIDFVPESLRPIVTLATAFPLSLLIVYLVGWFFSVIINFKDPSAPIPDEPPDWHKR